MSYFTFFPTRNGEETLEQTLTSLLNQTVKPLKVIIADDGSTDDTREILDRFRRDYPDKFILLHYRDVGTDFRKISFLYNDMLKHAEKINAAYQFALADDIILPAYYCEELIRRMDADDKLVVTSGCIEEDDRSPCGAARMIRDSFFRKISPSYEYPLLYGYESWIMEEALHYGFEINVFETLRIIHLRDLGAQHHFREFGKAMYCLRYHPLYVFFRTIHLLRKIGLNSFIVFADWLFCSFSNDQLVGKMPKRFEQSIRSRQVERLEGIVLIPYNRTFGRLHTFIKRRKLRREMRGS